MSRKAKGTSLRELPILVVSALILSIVVKTFLVQFFYIPSGSMENTLQVNDRVGVNKLGTLFSDIKRGEVVVFRDPASWLSAPYDDSTGIKCRVRWFISFKNIWLSNFYIINRQFAGWATADHMVSPNSDYSLDQILFSWIGQNAHKYQRFFYYLTNSSACIVTGKQIGRAHV